MIKFTINKEKIAKDIFFFKYAPLEKGLVIKILIYLLSSLIVLIARWLAKSK